MSDSLWPHSPGQNTIVGSLSLLQDIFPTQGLNQGLLHCRRILYQLSYQGSPESESESRSVMSDSLQPHGLYSPWNSPGQKTGVGSLPLLQEIFPTQGSNPGLLHCRWILYELSHKGSPGKPYMLPKGLLNSSTTFVIYHSERRNTPIIVCYWHSIIYCTIQIFGPDLWDCLYVVAVVQSLSCIWLLVTPQTAACQASLFFTISQSLVILMSIELVMPSNVSSPEAPFPPALNLSRIRVFLNESALRIRWLIYEDGLLLNLFEDPEMNEYSRLSLLP